jgi:hypothetical protein
MAEVLRKVPSLKVTVVTAVLATAGCSGMMNTPTAQNIAGLPPSGNATITEDFVAGMGGGSGTLYFQGQTYPFRFVGTVAGPGGGVEKISASGPIYKLASVGDFGGRYTQSTGKAGFSSSGSSDLWLENSAGVIMHLQGASSRLPLSGATFSSAFEATANSPSFTVAGASRHSMIPSLPIM